MRDDEALSSSSTDPPWTKLAAAMAQAVRRQCPWWLSEHAQDIAQTALAKVVAIVKDREGDQPLSSFYLHKVAHSALVDEIRRRKRRREVALEIVDAPGEQSRQIEPVATGTPEDDASFRELGAAVRECLGGMKRERRLAVLLYLQDHTVPQAAKILGWAAKRTENLVYRGLADLRACLRSKGHTP
jgi:RNA polymerase sigma-70 factor, ECF subfamily